MINIQDIGLGIAFGLLAVVAIFLFWVILESYNTKKLIAKFFYKKKIAIVKAILLKYQGIEDAESLIVKEMVSIHKITNPLIWGLAKEELANGRHEQVERKVEGEREIPVETIREDRTNDERRISRRDEPSRTEPRDEPRRSNPDPDRQPEERRSVPIQPDTKAERTDSEPKRVSKYFN